MKPRTVRHRLASHWIAAAIAAAACASLPGIAGAQAIMATQTSSDRGVTVKVTPKSAGAAAEWEFGVVLDTHSADLSDDLVTASVLVIDGTELRPLAWTGAAPGGHHREGTLKFPAPPQAPQRVELRIQRPGEAVARVFRWDAAASR